VALHDIPADDGTPHSATSGCGCQPTRYVGNRGDGTHGVLYVHHTPTPGSDDREATDAVAHE